MSNDTRVNIVANRESNILVRIGGAISEHAGHDTVALAPLPETELEQMQVLANGLPGGTVHVAPDERAEIFYAPVYGDALDVITEVGDVRQWGKLFFMWNAAAVLPGSMIFGFVGGAVASQGHTDPTAGGLIAAGIGVTLGNLTTLIVGKVYQRSYNIMRKVNALAFTRWLRVRHGVRIYPQALTSIMYAVNGEAKLGALGKIIKDINGQPVMLVDAKKGGITVRAATPSETIDTPAVEPVRQPEVTLSADTAVFTGTAENLYKNILDELSGLSGKTLAAEDSYVVERVQQDITNLMSSVRLLQPLNEKQTLMVTDTLGSLFGELQNVTGNTTAEAERALEIQHRYVQERNGGGLSLSKRQKGGN